MVQRTASGLLVVALVAAGGLAPSANLAVNRRSPRQRLLVKGGRRCVDEAEPGHTRVGDRQLSVALATLVDAHPKGHAGAPALVEPWALGFAPDLPGGLVPVASTSPRLNLDPHVVLGTRGPP